MIDRYSITATAAKVQDRFHAEVLGKLDMHYNAAPTHLLPVITHSTPQGVSTFFWGTSPDWSKNKALGEKIINIPAETILEKISIKKKLTKTRCLIPADGFYAWRKVGKKTAIPYRFVVTDQELFSFAGLWEEFEDTDGNEIQTFSMITTTANNLVSSVQERMPVILKPAAEKVWMSKESTEDELLQLLVPYAPDKMNHYPVSPRIHDATVNVASLIIPTPPSDQFGNLTLFD